MKYNWTNLEIKELFNKVEECKKNSQPILDAFYSHAKKYDRKPLSVRNFYYQKADEILQDKKLQKQLSINIKLHEKDNYAKFDERQTEKLINYVKQRQREGKSVRSACLELAENDATKLVRLQNKFRSEQTKISKTEKTANKMQNVISFPVENKLKQTPLNDSEIQSLFLGLVNLIKKTAKFSLEQEFQKERENFSIIIKKNAIELAGKTEKLDFALNENQKLSQQVVNLKQKLEQLRAEFSKKINLEKN